MYYENFLSFEFYVFFILKKKINYEKKFLELLSLL